MIVEMKVLKLSAPGLSTEVGRELEDHSVEYGVGHDEYLRFTMAYEDEEKFPALFAYLRSMLIADNETILVEFP